MKTNTKMQLWETYKKYELYRIIFILGLLCAFIYLILTLTIIFWLSDDYSVSQRQEVNKKLKVIYSSWYLRMKLNLE